MTSSLLLLPSTTTETIDLSGTRGSLFWKKLLPLGSITYEGRKINFDRQYLEDLVDAFKKNAFDQLSFQLARDDGRHTIDAERWRGEFVDLAIREDGLYGALKPANDDVAKMLRENKKMAVSPRIFENLKHATGTAFKRAMHHVLGTLDPRIPGMGEWQEVSLSAEDVDETVDLTQQEWDPLGEEGNVTDTNQPDADAEGTNNEGDELTPEEQNLIDRIADEQENAQQDDDEAGGETEDEGNNDGEGDGEVTEVQDHAREGGSADPVVTDLARQLADQVAATRAIQVDLARERFNNEARDLIDAGVPPVLVDLARPYLSMPAHDLQALDLSRTDGETAKLDLARDLRQMLNEVKGILDLNREAGTSWTAEDGKDPEDVLLEAWEVA